ncbi:MAG: class I SAM-dependent methyltransferase [Syntrophothermus sp.]
MPTKPKQFTGPYASIFQDASVISDYQHRPMYPAETFAVLLRLIQPADKLSFVLDAGCGTGFIARPLADYVDRIDAVDISAGMIAMAKTLPGGDRPNIHWMVAPIETAPLSGPYALIVAAASIPWMDWERTLPRFADHLAPKAWLALVEEIHVPNPWDQQVAPMIQHYSMNKDFIPHTMQSLAEELEQRQLFQLHGSYETASVPFQQPIDSYIQSFHARNGFSLDRMDPLAAAQFDRGLRAEVEPFCPNGLVEQKIRALILWGRPLSGKTK